MPLRFLATTLFVPVLDDSVEEDVAVVEHVGRPHARSLDAELL